MVIGQRTYPDYGVYPSKVITPDVDMGELAARLGSPRFKREGRILSFADCSPGLEGWYIEHDIKRITYYPAVGNGCLMCENTGAGSSAITKFYPISSNRRIGLEFMFNNQLISNNNIITFLIAFWENLTAKIARIRIYMGNGNVYYENDGSPLNLLVNTPVISMNGNWVDVKLVADADQDQYIRLEINNTPYQITSALKHEATAGPEYGSFFAIYGNSFDGIGQFRFLLDSMVITNNEY